MMVCKLGATIVHENGKKLSPWAGTLGWVAGKAERQGVMTCWPGVFFVWALGRGEEEQMGFLSLCEGKQGFQP